jgi:flagellar biosynthesis/type III secretory pathway protein FliH
MSRAPTAHVPNDGLALFLNVAAALDAPGVHLARALSETLAPIAEETQSRLEVERHDREEMERDRERALIAKGRARGFSAGYDSGYQEGYEAAGENAA